MSSAREAGIDLETARALAYTHLNRRERSTHEVRDHLLARGADDGLVTALIQELTEEGYLDDRRFARLFTQDKRELSGWGSGRIRRALLERGIPAEEVESALGEAQDDPHGAGDEPARALALLRQRFPAPLATSRDSRRALGVLMRKGYDYELAVDALAEHGRQLSDAIAPPRPRY